MGKNYQQVRKQRELAKKARQQQKQVRRIARHSAAAPTPPAPSEGDHIAASDVSALDAP
jgi:sRNA-binding protein